MASLHMSADSGPRSARPRKIWEYFTRYRATFLLGILFLGLTQAAALSVPQLLRIATDGLVAQSHDVVWNAAIGIMMLAVAGAVVRILSRVLIFNSGRRVEYDIRSDVFGHLQALAPSFYQQMPPGQVMSRMVADLSQIRLLLGPGLLNLTNTALVYLVAIPLLLLMDWQLTLMALLPLPVLLGLGRIFAKYIYKFSREAQDKLGVLSSKVQENLSGVMTVRAYSIEKAEEQAFLNMADDYLATNIKMATLRGTMFPLMGLAGAFGGIVVLWVGGHRIAAGEMTVGQFVQFNSYLAALTWPTIALGWMISMWQRGTAAMDRINEIFSSTPTIVDGATQPGALKGHIELRNLTYRYGSDLPAVLDNVSTEIKPGELVVIVGRTGAGKSSLLKALARMLEVEAGQIYMDGHDVTTLPLNDIRQTIGYAPQDAFLFSRTIFENVAFGQPDTDDASVQKALKMACFDTDVDAFPEGVETVVGERGITLSGGQRQRTTLARAILPNFPVILLDDTLSAVDTETETEILKALVDRDAQRTLIMATHRLACAAKADRILVLEEGKLVEHGTEPELLALDGVYAQMHRRQRLREAVSSGEPQSSAAPELPRAVGDKR
ncbi:MAG: ABC transporter ATP-binding protein [Myxococcota bacterium]